MVHRVFYGEWRLPYPNKHPFEVITKVSKEHFRPELDASMPPMIVELVKQCWHAVPTQRPNCEQILEALMKIEEEFVAHKDTWTKIYTKVPRQPHNSNHFLNKQ